MMENFGMNADDGLRRVDADVGVRRRIGGFTLLETVLVFF